MKLFLNIMILLPLSLYAVVPNYLPYDSTAPGIHFEQGSTWKKILEKAKTENRYIFVDCYTTWCLPCKKMEVEVYPLQKAGDFFNDKFICIKIQMDTTQKDNDVVKMFYADAHYLKERYKIQGYPTLLFFTPDANILSKSMGAQGTDALIQLGTDALNPQKNYYKLLANYKRGKRDMVEMSYLARTALELLGDTAQSEKIAKTYLESFKKEAWFVKDNIQFMAEFTKNLQDIGFHLFYQYKDTINKVMADDDYAERFVSSIIYKEIILPEIERADRANTSPDWNALTLNIRTDYGNYYAERGILVAKLNWQRHHKNWPEYIKYFVLFVDKYDTLRDNISPNGIEDFFWNNRAWEVFKYSYNKEELIKALHWSNRAVMMNPTPDWIDTYASILYKLGYDNLAISWEELAVKQDPTNTTIQSALEKMKKKEPTWPIQ
jgi:thiol-disulfide isomerase/thioredoxin